MITPSISVLSAIEGLNVATEAARPMVGFKEIMKLQPRPKPGHKHQQGNPDRSRGNLHRVGPENLNNLFVY
jgi:hypothetical protein